MMYLLYEDKELNINISEGGRFYIIEKLIPGFGNIVIDKTNNKVKFFDSDSETSDYICRHNHI